MRHVNSGIGSVASWRSLDVCGCMLRVTDDALVTAS